MKTEDMAVQLTEEIMDLAIKRYYCNDSEKGRKMRKRLDAAIRIKEKQLRSLGYEKGV